jgi:hypothetical protein
MAASPPPPLAVIATTALTEPAAFDDEQVVVASAAMILNPGINKTTPCFLLVDGNEWMEVEDTYPLGDLTIPVVRGFNGTIGVAHAIGAVVQVFYDVNAGPYPGGIP